MDYCGWNNLLGDFFFHPENEGKTISLIISELDVCELGRISAGFEGVPGDDIIANFKSAWRNGLPGTYGNIINRIKGASQKGLYAFQRGEESLLCGDTVLRFPPALVYFAGISLALTYGKATSRYVRIREYFNVSSEQFPGMGPELNWNQAYEKLTWWTNTFKAGALGYLPAKTLSSLRYEYMAKPYTFILLSKKQLSAFHQFLYDDEAEPGTSVSQQLLLKALKYIHADKHLADILQSPESEERKTAISILNSLYRIWDGQNIIETAAGKATFQLRKLRLCFTLNMDSGYGSFSLRFREDVFKNGQFDFGNCKTTILPNGWSKPIPVPSVPGNLVLKDTAQGLRAVFKPADSHVFVFRNGRAEGLNSDIWIEADQIDRSGPQYILTSGETGSPVQQWLVNIGGQEVTDDLLDFGGWQAYYFVEGIAESFNGTEKLMLPERTSLAYRGGLKGNNRGEYITGYGFELVLSGASGEERLQISKTDFEQILLPDRYGVFNISPDITAGVYQVTLLNTTGEVFIPNYGRLVLTDVVFPENNSRIFSPAMLEGNADPEEKQLYQNSSNVVDNMHLAEKMPPQLVLWRSGEADLGQLSAQDMQAIALSEYMSYRGVISKATFEEAFTVFADAGGTIAKESVYTLLALTASRRFSPEYRKDGSIHLVRPVKPFIFRLGNFHNYSANMANTPFTGALYVLGGAYTFTLLCELKTICEEKNILMKVYPESDNDGLLVPPSVLFYTSGKNSIRPVLELTEQQHALPYFELTREVTSVANKITEGINGRQSEAHFEDRCKLFDPKSFRFYARPTIKERQYPSLALYEMSAWDHLYILRLIKDETPYQFNTDPRYGRLMLLNITGNDRHFLFDVRLNILALPSRLRPPESTETNLYFFTGRLPARHNLYGTATELSVARNSGTLKSYLIYKGILKDTAEKLAVTLGQKLHHLNIKL